MHRGLRLEVKSIESPLSLVKNKTSEVVKSARRGSIFTSLPPDRYFDSITRLAIEICKMPVAMVMHVEQKTRWIVSSVGLSDIEYSGACMDICSAALAQEELMEVDDLSLDYHFYDNPIVNRGPLMRYFKGVPLLAGGHPIGILAAMDDRLGGLSYTQCLEFNKLGRVVAHTLDNYHTPPPAGHFEAGASIDRELYFVDADSLDILYQCPCSGGDSHDAELKAASGTFLDILANVELVDFAGHVAPLRAQEKSHIIFEAVFRIPGRIARPACLEISLDKRPDANLFIIVVSRLSSDQPQKVELSDLVDDLPGTLIYRMHKGSTWITDYVSLGYRALTGGNPDDVKGSKVAVMRDITHPDDKVRAWSAINTALSARKPFEITYRIITFDEQTRWVREQGRGRFSKDGQVLAIEGVVFDVTRQQRQSSKLGYQATHDYLTGLCNRREFEQRLIRAVENAKNRRSEHALCYLDLDQFKIINDTCGHRAGDQLLRRLNGVLKSVTRQRDTLARLGGDEFGILMEHCALPEARRVATLVLEGIRNLDFSWQGRSFRVGVSIGIVMVTNTTKDAISILQMADRSSYVAKKKGGNRIHVCQGDGELPLLHDEARWVSRINRALEGNQFRLYRQSIEAISDKEDRNRTRFEVMLRMLDDKDQEISPEQFLPAAESYHIVPRIDRWVISQVFAWLAGDPAEMRKLDLCSINLSGQSLTDEEFPAFVTYQLQRSKISPEKICFEITETAAITNITRARHFIEMLRNIGFCFALDDFGSGLSSFAYLKKLPVDFVKIDGLFVQNMLEDTSDQAMVSAITHIAHMMGKKVVAEWVENVETQDQLRALNVDFVQGFGVEKPRPINTVLGKSG